MNFFDDDGFESIIDQFFGGRAGPRTRRRKQFIRGEDEDRVIDFIETDDFIYLIFELPGYNEKDILVSVAGNRLDIRAQKKNNDNVQDYLAQKLSEGAHFSRELPGNIKSKKFSHTMRNGILEVIFEKR